MAAQAERFPTSLARACCRDEVLKTLYGCIAVAAVAIGVLGLLHGSWPTQVLDSRNYVHVLFALLLCGLVFARFRWHVKHSPPMLPADIHGLTRHLSRIVYLSLYAVIGVRETVGIVSSLWHGGSVDFNLFDPRFRNGPDYAGFNPRDDFQLFIASGLVALVFVRILTCRLWFRSDERATLSTTATEALSPRPTTRPKIVG
jgi:cytochrome b561